MKFSKSHRYLKKVNSSSVYDVADITPLSSASFLSSQIKNNVFLKREDLQPVFSFKLRGAYNKILTLKEDNNIKRVITASAGNHAQGVAYSAQRLKLKSTIVMPVTTPTIKIRAVKNLGAQVVLVGDTYDEAYKHAIKIAKNPNFSFVHPYDDEEVIAGQGTIGKEILDQFDEKIDAIFVPVGGGGLLAGIGAYVKSLRPEIKIIGVEPEEAAGLYEAVKANRRVTLKEVGLFVDGVAVKQVGKVTFPIIKEWIDEVVTVSVDEICAAVEDIFLETRTISEPAGALSLAGLKKLVKNKGWRNKNLIAINSGANLNFDRLSHIVERVQLGEKKEALLSVCIPEKKGSFRVFCNDLGKRMITEFNYRIDDEKEANIFVACRVDEGQKEKKSFIKDLRKKGYSPKDLSENEMAKLHVKHMVGGRAPKDVISYGEKIFRVEFPERPGALMDFLTALGDKWNITMFHYRNQGSAYGRVLVGFQVNSKETHKLNKHLIKTGFPFWDESHNSAYLSFLE
mgnify:CR=1 FL=1|tara:strand:+ start:238 stop:1773 length:1536 start_codon:yes stop_codon:yes gene_type:complete